MSKLVGIPGLKRGEVECKIVGSITEALRTVKPGLAATGAGESGAINVWLGDDGDYRVQVWRRCALIASGSFAQKSKLRAWLKAWWPQMGDQERLASLA